MSLTTSGPSLQIIIIVSVNDDRDRMRGLGPLPGPSLPEFPPIAQSDHSQKAEQLTVLDWPSLRGGEIEAGSPTRPSDRPED